MALNFSRRPIFPLHLSEDNIVSPMRIANGYIVEGIPENNVESCGKSWHCGREVDACFDHRNDICSDSSQDPVSKDILDILPADPFGMDISTTFTALTGWLEDMEVDYAECVRDGGGTGERNVELFAGLNFFWNNALKFQAFPEIKGIVQKPDPMCSCDGFLDEKETGDVSCSCDFRSICSMDEVSFADDDPPSCCGQQAAESEEQSCIYSEVDGGAPHAGLSFALCYLGVRDLLSVGRVCKSLHSVVQGDPLLWRNIHIEQPLNEKITDDILLQLSNRALGNLQCLSLVECPRITDEGLKHVLESNPRLTKLCVPGCTRLSIEGVVSSLRAFKLTSIQGVKLLRIGGLFGVTQEHFEELKFLLGSGCSLKPQNSYKPHFYHRGNFYVSCDDERAIDIEKCPRCENLRLVYDCPVDGCQGKEYAAQACRACTLCISRCIQCGRCINENEFVETFSLELLCSGCWKPSLECREERDWREQEDDFFLHG
ncbi:F-box protein SKIP14 [Cucurbita pepo subsp. pepo]|uniref:F-box protein SKIP14 n=1 Tax=Cucurbita pepo subsp. pepo TaxID=3664 RepID=UPI000C9D61AD|nr:F-box protein SKIP14 [Cucurbita pepo subsp. pepo]